jgi:Glycosyltransferase family 87
VISTFRRYFTARRLLLWFIWSAAFVFCSLVLAYSLGDLMHYAGMDLRNRVVGARALLSSLDPYSIDWRPGMPLDLADRWQRYPGVTKVTVAPSGLLMYLPFAEYSYKTQHLIWWFLQWLAMLGSIFILARSFSDRFDQKIFLTIAIVCFVGSWFWRLHVERGQYYIFVVLAICLDLAALRHNSRRPVWLGIPSGIAVAIKPTCVLLLPSLWFLGERRAALTGSLMAALGVAASLYPSGPTVWLSFLSGVNGWAQAEIDPTYESRHFGPVLAVAPDVIEGMDFRRALGLGHDYRIVPNPLTWFFKADWGVHFSQVAMLVLCTCGPIAVWWLRRRSAASQDTLLLLITLLLVLVDFVRPQRYTYVDVNFLPLTAFLVTLLPRSLPFVLIACLAYACYLAPLEGDSIILARYFLTTVLAGVTIAIRSTERWSAQSSPSVPRFSIRH